MEQNKFYLNHSVEGNIEVYDVRILDRNKRWFTYTQIIDGEEWKPLATIPVGDIRNYISRKPFVQIEASTQHFFDESVKTIYWERKNDREIKYFVDDVSGNYRPSITKIKYFKIIFDSTKIKVTYYFQMWSKKSHQLEWFEDYMISDKEKYSSLLDFKSKHIFETLIEAKDYSNYVWELGKKLRAKKSSEIRLELHAQKKTRLYSSQEEPRLWQHVGYDMR